MSAKKTHQPLYLIASGSPNDEGYQIPDAVRAKAIQHPLLKALFVPHTGYFPRSRNHHIKRRPIPETVVIYCTEGRGGYRWNGRTWDIRAGDILFCWHDIPHHYWSDKDDPWTIHWAHCQGREVDVFLDALGLRLKSPVLHIGQNVPIVDLFNDMRWTYREGHGLPQLIFASNCFRQILARLLIEQHRAQPVSGANVSLKKVMAYLHQHLQKPLTLEQMAKEACLSREHFVRKFRALTGYTPMSYFIRLKIQKACELLTTSDMTIQAIGHYIAYDDPYYFSRIFKKIMGQSPKAYRRQKTI